MTGMVVKSVAIVLERPGKNRNLEIERAHDLQFPVSTRGIDKRDKNLVGNGYFQWIFEMDDIFSQSTVVLHVIPKKIQPFAG